MKFVAIATLFLATGLAAPTGESNKDKGVYKPPRNEYPQPPKDY